MFNGQIFRYKWISRCVTYEECTSIPDKKMFIIDGENCTHTCPKRYMMKDKNERKYCEHCGDECVKICDGAEVENMNILKGLEGCTHINGSLTIKLGRTATITEKDLAYNLEEIRVISGELNIQKMHQIESLDFLKGLREVQGLKTHKYVLNVRDNVDLKRLFDLTTTNLTLGPGNISFHYNPMLCLSTIEAFANRTNKTGSFLPDNLHISKLSNGDQAACSIRSDFRVTELNKNATFITLSWGDSHVDTKDLIGYYVYYKETKSCEEKRDVNRDNCDTQDWSTHLVRKPFVNLTDLNPFTSYLYYIKILSNKSGSETPVMCFKSSAHDPSPPSDVALTPISPDTITLSWKASESPNGLISHYVLLGFVQSDDRTLLDKRNYCNRGVVYEPNEPKISGEEEVNGTCNCDDFVDLNTKTLEKLCYYDVSLGMDLLNSCNDYKIEIINLPADLPIDVGKRWNGGVGVDLAKAKHEEVRETIDANVTIYNITNLYHFTKYVFYFSACNTEDGVSHCSAIIMEYARTLRKEGADDVRTIEVDVDRKNIYVSWKEPEAPNGVIVSYNLVYGPVDSAGTNKVCITRSKHAESEFTYVIEGLGPGKYEIQVQAASLSGEGKFTEPKIFAVSSNSDEITVVVMPVLFCLIVVASLALYYRYKWKRESDSMHLIARVNPDYAGTSYVADEWEMERSDVEIKKELGKGTFGMVYMGFIRSKGIPCAIKTMNEHTNINDRFEFLNEASVMKSFNEAHHVVRLLGVVSKGQPPLVIMELMDREDLKTYLRGSRGSSNSITCTEMYRMAAEIADGMAYLAAKKFIHRDLAARNCMVSADYTVKIGDFGMARDIYETDYYRKGTKGLLPVRWMAPESLQDGVFTSDSDVWSYGVVLWEMATLAEQPYQGLANEQVFQFVVARGTLDRPPDCPDLLYEIMQVCWKWKPYDRPLFTDIVEKLESHIGQDFRLVSFYHSREGEEYRLNNRERVYNHPALSIPLQEEIFAQWKASDEEVSLYSGNGDRPTEILSSYPHQRHGSRPSSNYCVGNSSSPNGYDASSLTSM